MFDYLVYPVGDVWVGLRVVAMVEEVGLVGVGFEVLKALCHS